MSDAGNMMNNPKQRNMFIVTGAVAFLAIAVGVWYAGTGSSTPVSGQGGVQVSEVPNVKGAHGVSDSQRYNNMVQESNMKGAETAMKNNTTSLPTPTNTNAFNTESPIDAIDRERRLQREKEEKERVEKEAELAKAPQSVPLPQQPVIPQVQVAQKPEKKYSSQEDYMLLMTLNGMAKSKASKAEVDFAGEKQARSQQSLASAGSSAQSQQAAQPKALPDFKAGTMFNAVLETGINSDEPSPVLAKIVSGDLKGTRLIGKMTTSGEKVIVEFSTASVPGQPSSVRLNAVAVDPGTSRTGLATDVDRHYFLKYGVLLASAFLGGYADALARQNTVVTTSPLGGATTSYGELSTSDINKQAIGSVGKELANQTRQDLAGKKPTITVDAGIAIGVLLMDDLFLAKK